MVVRVKYFLFSLFILGVLSSFAQTPNLDGSWEGKLMINPGISLRLGINVSGAGSEDATVSLDSPDQGAYGIPMQIEYISADSLNVTVVQLMLQYKGKLEGDSIKGVFSQGPMSLPLILKPKLNTLNRPQTPLPPFPYLTEEVTFKSALDGAPLYGTLSLPDNNIKDTRAVLFVTGSGTQNRDEEIFGHKPFAVIADYLARNGIASLRYDDRGFDTSKNQTPNPTTYENTMDAIGGVNFLREKGFSKIGIIGHSEGGLIADKIASADNQIDFIVELGGPALPGDSILIFQNEFLLKDGGVPEEYISMYLEALNGIFKSQKDIDPVPFDESKYVIFSSENLVNPVIAPLVKNLRENISVEDPWIKYFINYDPMVDMRNISVPVLMLYGEKDTQVPPSINVPVLLKNVPEVSVKVYPDLNHLMQHCKTGKFTEYNEIEETISTEVLEDIKLFIQSIAGGN